jgi:HEAT repeat protein
MRKRVQIALAVLLVAVGSVIVWQALQPGEPVYQGRPLSSWLTTYRTRLTAYRTRVQINESIPTEARIAQQKADEAVRDAGTNALPTLLRMLRAKDSALKVKLLDLAKRQRFIKIKYTPAEERNREARRAFEALGATAQSAVPTLIEIADRDISHTSQCCTIDALVLVGQPAKEAIPSLLRWATNADYEVRYCAIRALGKIGAEPDRVLPVLIKALPDSSSVVRMGAVWSLTDFEQNTKLAVPALVEFLNAPSDSMSDRSYATNALLKIDPAAAAKAGVK